MSTAHATRTEFETVAELLDRIPNLALDATDEARTKVRRIAYDGPGWYSAVGSLDDELAMIYRRGFFDTCSRIRIV